MPPISFAMAATVSTMTDRCCASCSVGHSSIGVGSGVATTASRDGDADLPPTVLAKPLNDLVGSIVNRPGVAIDDSDPRVALSRFEDSRTPMPEDQRDELVRQFFAERRIKAKFGGSVRCRKPVAQVNEVLCKILCHNICVLIQSMYELGIAPALGMKERQEAA